VDFGVVLAVGLPAPDAQAAVASVMQMAITGFFIGRARSRPLGDSRRALSPSRANSMAGESYVAVAEAPCRHSKDAFGQGQLSFLV
jgi:hypothetical protein